MYGIARQKGRPGYNLRSPPPTLSLYCVSTRNVSITLCAAFIRGCYVTFQLFNANIYVCKVKDNGRSRAVTLDADSTVNLTVYDFPE